MQGLCDAGFKECIQKSIRWLASAKETRGIRVYDPLGHYRGMPPIITWGTVTFLDD